MEERMNSDLAALEIVRAAVRVRGANVVVLSGAGYSTGAGLPTYRGKGGVWTNTPGLAKILSAGIKPSDYELLWKHVDGVATGASPARAHVALAHLADGIADRNGTLTVITQNIDGLHDMAGTPAIELHGSTRRVLCSGDRCDTAADRAGLDTDTQGVPRCTLCRSRCRPDVVLFGEDLDDTKFATAMRVLAEADVLIVAGTSLEVHPVATLPFVAEEHGSMMVWANVAPPPNWIRFSQQLLGPIDDVMSEIAYDLDE